MRLEHQIARIICGPPHPHESPLWGPLGTVYERKGEIRGYQWEIQWKVDNPLGRFGGCWNWSIGAEIGSETILLNVLTFTIRIERNIEEDET